MKNKSDIDKSRRMKKNFFLKSKKNTESNQNEIPFQSADPDLDLFTQARMNLQNFKVFFAQNPSNAIEPYQIVAATVSKAFANLTNKSAELELEKEAHDRDMASIIDDIKLQNEEYETVTKFVDEMKNRLEIIKSRNLDLKKQLIKVSDRIKTRKIAH